MVTTVTCQNCGERVSSEYARVFGNDSNELHACSNCSTQRAVARGAAVDDDRDGTPMVHRPDTDDPVRTVTTVDDEPTEQPERYRLETLRDGTWDGSTATSHTENSKFEALVNR